MTENELKIIFLTIVLYFNGAITDKPFSVRMPMDYVKGFNCQR